MSRITTALLSNRVPYLFNDCAVVPAFGYKLVKVGQNLQRTGRAQHQTNKWRARTKLHISSRICRPTQRRFQIRPCKLESWRCGPYWRNTNMQFLKHVVICGNHEETLPCESAHGPFGVSNFGLRISLLFYILWSLGVSWRDRMCSNRQAVRLNRGCTY